MSNEMPKIEFHFKDRKREIKIILDGQPTDDQKAFIREIVSHAVDPVGHKERFYVPKRLWEKIKQMLPRRPNVNYYLDKVNNATLRKKYQVRYVCPSCHKKDTTYVDKGVRQVQCMDCGQPMSLRDATKRGFPHTDSWGNTFVAGMFKREDEWMDQNRTSIKNPDLLLRDEGSA